MSRFPIAIMLTQVALAAWADAQQTTLRSPWEARVATEADGLSGSIVARPGDVSTEEGVQELVSGAVDTLGSLDVVVNVAGILSFSHSHEVTLDEWNRLIAVNLTGTFLVCRASMLVMCDQGFGSIVVTSSPHAVATVADTCAYAASKGGVNALVRALSLEGAPFGVRANAVVPGTIDTPMIRREAQASSDPDAQMVAMAAGQPLGRLGRPIEVANVALFLASPLADFITGSLVSVDGGLLAGLPSGPPLSYNN